MMELKQVAKELNEKLGLEPTIEVDRDEGYLKEMISEACLLVVKEDQFSDEMWSILLQFGCKVVPSHLLSKASSERSERAKPVPTPKPVKAAQEISLASFLDQLLLKGGTVEQLLLQISQESKKRGKKTYQAKYDITWHISDRKKKGWPIQEIKGVYKLERIP